MDTSETKQEQGRDTELHCEKCGTIFGPQHHITARWITAASAAVIGGIATRSILGGAALGALAYFVARTVDVLHYARRCPECGTIVGPVVFRKRRKAEERRAAGEPEVGAAA